MMSHQNFWKFYWQDTQNATQWLYETYRKTQTQNSHGASQEMSLESSAHIIGMAINEFDKDGDDKKNLYQPLPYPKTLTATDILEIHLAGGAMLVQDLGTYLHRVREKKGLSIRACAKLIGVAHTAIHRLEKGDINRALLKTILELDQVLNLDGEAITIGWSASEFHTGVIRNRAVDTGVITRPAPYDDKHTAPYAWGPRERAFADTLIKIARWHKKLGSGNDEWLNNLRSQTRFYGIQ